VSCINAVQACFVAIDALQQYMHTYDFAWHSMKYSCIILMQYQVAHPACYERQCALQGNSSASRALLMLYRHAL